MKLKVGTLVAVLVAATATILGAVVTGHSSASPPGLTADRPSAAPEDLGRYLKASVGKPHSPLGAMSADAITHLLTPVDKSLPSFFSTPTTRGGRCIATSDLVVSSCLEPGNKFPGTITLRDDSEGDARPPLIYGLVRPNVKNVVLHVEGATYDVEPRNGFYVVLLDSAEARVEDVSAVTYVLADGRTVERRLTS